MSGHGTGEHALGNDKKGYLRTYGVNPSSSSGSTQSLTNSCTSESVSRSPKKDSLTHQITSVSPLEMNKKKIFRTLRALTMEYHILNLSIIQQPMFKTNIKYSAGLLAKGQYPEGPATGHLGTGFAWFPCVCL